MTVQWQVLEIALLFAFLSVSPEQNPDVGALADLIEDMESTLNVSFPNGFDGEPTLCIHFFSEIMSFALQYVFYHYDDGWKLNNPTQLIQPKEKL